ncbi:MAG: hypothetical protein R3202_13695, partial [Candidatus Competibacterales bacterium]|nr:hypothetical protein [Candidatus Competibacterales bacterium]
MPDETALPSGCEPRCRACAHRRLSTAAGLGRKTAWLTRALAPWRDRLAPIRTNGPRWGYRERFCLRAVAGAHGWRFGLGEAERFVAIPDCPVHSVRARAALAALTHGLPTTLALARVVQSGAQLTLILASRTFPRLDTDPALFERLAQAGIEGLWLNLHPATGRRLFAKSGWHLLWGRPWSRDKLGLWHGPAGFQQLLPRLYARSLDEAEAFL